MKKSPALFIKEAVSGFFMALADSVPGVSDGTVAFMTGIYDDFIGSFGRIVGKDRKERKSAILFLLRLGVGWLLGMGISVTILSRIFTSHIYQVSSLFLGLVAASIPVILAEEKETLKSFRPLHLIPGLAGIAAVVLLCVAHFSVSTTSLTVPGAIYIFIGGALAISAMVLPGISGSTLLLAFGLYVPVITGVKDFLHLNFSSFPLLLVFGFGVLFGIFASFKGIHYLLKRFRTAMVCLIVGLMLGSLYAIVRGPTTLSEPLPAMTFSTFHPVYFIVGILIVSAFAAVKYSLLKRRETHAGMDHTA